MVSPKKFLAVFASLLLVVVFGLSPTSLLASQKQYFDWGPYYQTSQVLGFSFSNLENLPALQLPDGLTIPAASGLLPDSPFYFFEKAIENTQLALTFDPIQREQLRVDLAAERLSEAKTLMDQGKTAAASQALDDYGKTLTSIAENLATIAQQNTPGAQELIKKVEEEAAAQAVSATALSLSSAPAQAEGWTEAGNASRQLLDKVAEVNGEPALPQEISGSIQTLKEQGLISEEESNKLYSLPSRSEVREEFNKLASTGGLPPSEMARLDKAIERYYPDVQNQQITNLQVVELRSYQSLSQPSTEVVEKLQKWQDDPASPPSNDIKPYLWYNRAQGLAREVDLSSFSEKQQSEVAKLYPTAVTENPTYSPPPSPSPTPAPSPATDQEVSPTPTVTVSPSPSPSATSVPADPYLQDIGGALPGEPTYFLKQLREGFNLTFTFDGAEKSRLRMQYAEARLAEAQALSSDPNKASLYESTLKSYQQTVADASNDIKQLSDSKAARKVAQQLEAQAGRHEVVFEKGLLPPPAKHPELVSQIIQTTEDAMDRSADVLDRPALPPALSSRLGDLKAQGLILPEEAEDLIKSSSREEVRSKIRKLVELKTFPLADAKKLDESQAFTSPDDYNQLNEVRKVEELQNLRSVQSDLAQTPTLKSQATTLSQRETVLTGSIDPTIIRKEDLAGREDLIKTYEKLSSAPRPINGGQFGAEATAGATPKPVITPSPRDAVLSTCPEGATFKQFEGCVWADSGKKINDYEQYKCGGSREYYSFAAKKCVAYDDTKGWNNEDAQPICPVGYTWSWQTQSCQTSTGGIIPYPSPSPEPEPVDDKEREERSKACPDGSSYKSPEGCVWDNDGKSVYDANQYRCSGRGQYYSFKEQRCVAAPQQGTPYPKDTAPLCKEPGAYWSWSEGKCALPVEPSSVEARDITIPKPFLAAPGSFLYPLKQLGETVRLATAITAEAKQDVRISQARERLAEGFAALEKGDKEDFSSALSNYTAKMQELYNDVSKSSLSDKARKTIGEKLAKEAAEQNLILQKIDAVATEDQGTAVSTASSVVVLGVDKAADLSGEAPIPDELKAKIESLPEKMISEEDKKTLLEVNSRIEARLKLGDLVAQGGLNTTDVTFLNKDFDAVDQGAKIKVAELKKLEDIAQVSGQKEKALEKIEKNEDIASKLSEFEKTFEPGKEIPAEIRSYIRLTRINEVAQTIRPDVVRLEDFQNRKDVLLAVATLQEEFKPTKEAIAQVEQFRRRNPNAPLPPEFARTEALAYSLGIRQQAGPCYLPTPPFPANTPCPAPGAAIPITSYANYIGLADRNFTAYSPGYTGGLGSGGPNTGYGNVGTPSLDKDGKPLVYGQGPKPESVGVCSDGYHWMYDNGGWCMSNSGNYSISYPNVPTGTGAGYTPYSPYYNAPGAPPATSGYPIGDSNPNDGCPYGSDRDGRGNCIPNSYPSSPYSYSPPSYYGVAPSYYTTNPPSGTVPGSGPKPTAPGQCPTGFHWMSDSGGWCMADGPTYVPGGSSYPAGTTTGETTPAGGYNCGSQPYDPVTKRCKDGACPGGFNWDGSKCVAGGYSGSYSGGGSTPWCWSASPPPGGWNCGSGSSWDSSTCSCKPSGGTSYSGGGGGYSTGSSYQYGCTPGYFWDGSKCTAGSYEGSGWSDTNARSQSWCQPPSGGCGSNSYWDYGSCYCRSSSTYYGGNGPSPSNQCQGLSCGGGAWLDYSTCSCKYSGGSGTSSTGSTITCYPPSAGCPGGWYDYGTCSCKSSSYSSSGTSSGGGAYCSPPSGGCGSGWFDTASCSCKSSSSQGCYNVSASSCGSGWYFDTGLCTCRQNSGSSTTTSGGTTSGGSSSGSSSSGSCPSGYHWMDNSWCMQDGGGGSTSTSTSTPSPTPQPTESTTTTSSTPAPTSAPTESTPAPTSAPTESTPAPTSAP